MTNSTLVYTTSTGDQPVIESPEPCLGSQGIISTAQCCRITESLTGEPCPLCIL